MLNIVINNLLDRYFMGNTSFNIVCDNAYIEISKKLVESIILKVKLYKISNILDVEKIMNSIIESNVYTLLLVEPSSFLEYSLYKWFDYSNGAPTISGVTSKVLVFPIESFKRIFSADIKKDIGNRDLLLKKMKVNTKYRVTNVNGTNLKFTSRQWIASDFEICTAPIENTINGVIAVDGALFFKKISTILFFYIKDGKIESIKTKENVMLDDLTEYENMTQSDFSNECNKQLAEIGLGFCGNAIISNCFMEAETVYNTCHFCFGNNECYGGINKSNFHGASILIKEPQFEIIYD